MTNKFDAKTTYRDVGTLIIQLTQKENTINLNADYQRDVVWNDEKQSQFINSVVRGIVPNAIILNDHTDMTQVCIDGKQRLTSLIRFKNNKIPYIIEDCEHVYYDTINTSDETKNHRIMTTEEKSIFLRREIPIVTYKNLSYEDQIEIFNRIQYGVALQAGELIAATFCDHKITNIFDNFCKKKEAVIKKFFGKREKPTSKKFKVVIANILYMIEQQILRIPSKCERNKFLKTYLNNTKIISEATSSISNLIDFVFNLQMLNHATILKKKLVQSIWYTIIYILGTDEKLNHYKLNSPQKIKKLRIAICRFNDKYRKNKKIVNNNNNMSTIQKKLIEMYNETTNDDSEDSVSDDSSDSDDVLSDESDREDSDKSEEYEESNNKKKIKHKNSTSKKKKSKKIETSDSDSESSSEVNIKSKKNSAKIIIEAKIIKN